MSVPNSSQPKKTSRRPESLLKFILRSILSPAVLTVIATAIVGPFIAQVVVNQMKEAELEANKIIKSTELETNRNIEQKKLQTDIIQRIFKSTDESDFTNPSQVARLLAMIMMVNENTETFGLKFDSSVSKLKAFREDLEDSEINAAQLQKEEAENEKAKLEVDKKKIEDEKVRLEEDLALMRKDLKKKRGQRKKDLENQIAATTRALEDAIKAEAEFTARIDGLNTILKEKTKKIDKLKEDLGKRLKENEAMQVELDGFKALSREKDASIKELRNALRAASKSIKEQSETIGRLEASLKVAGSEKDRAEEKLRLCEAPPVQEEAPKGPPRPRNR